MPLHIYQRNSAGDVLYARNEMGFRVAIAHPIELSQEMTDRDFKLAEELKVTFRKNSSGFVGQNSEDQNLISRISAFLSTKSIGPYYLLEDNQDAATSYGLILLDERDIGAFAVEFPDWELNAQSRDKNILAILDSLKNGRKPENQRLNNFCSDNGLYLAAAPTPQGS